MNKQYLTLLFRQLFIEEERVVNLKQIKDFPSEESANIHRSELKRAELCEKQCHYNIEEYIRLHS
jgi:hypothetical protein